MKIFNKLTAFIMSLLLIMSSLGVMAADGESIQVLGKEYTHTTNSQSTSTWGGNSVSFASLTLTYKVNVPEAGAYLIRPRFGTHLGKPSDITLEVNGTSLGTQTITPSDTATNFSAQTEYDMAIAWFNEGENTFKIGCTHNIYMSYFTLVPQDAGSLAGTRESLIIGEADYVEGATYPRGTDTITAGYDTPLLAGSFGAIELVDSDSNNVDFEATASGKELVIAIKDSLAYEDEYTLTLSGIKDMYGNELAEETFTFGTSDELEDSGSGSVDIDTFDIVSDDAVVIGTVMGSHGKGISGRNAELWITIPGEEPVMLAETVSSENGAYTLECNLSDYDINGDVTAEVVAEYADTSATAVKEDYMSAANQIKFMAGSYTNTTNSESTTGKGNTASVYYGTGITLTYEFTAVREGGFMLSMEQASYKGNPTTLTFELDGKTVHSYVFDPVTTDGNLGPMGTYDICGVWLTEGTHTFKISNSGTTHRIWNIMFTKQPAASFESAQIGGEAYAEDSTYSRGTDNISLSFTDDMSIEELGDIILTDNEGKEIGLEVSRDSTDSKKLVIGLKDSLDYAESYTLTASGIKDSCGYTMEDVVLSFATSGENDEDNGSDTAVIDSFEIKEGVATVKGSVMGSTGVGISGRKVNLYLTLPEYSEILAASTVTGEDGLYSLTYSLANDDAAGDCIAGIKAEYADDKVTDTYYYVSANRLIPILNALSNTTQGAGDTEASVEYVLEQNKVNLGIDPESDLAGITASDLYDMLIGAELDSIGKFHDLYKSSIALQKINEATESSVIESVIEANTHLLGIDYDKLDALNTTGLTVLYDEILSAGNFKDKAELNEVFDIAYNKALMTQAGLNDLNLVSDSDSAKQGAEIELTIESDASYKNAKEIKLTVVFEGCLAGNVNNIEFTTSIGKAKTDTNGSKADVTIIVEKPEESKTSIGNLSFTSSAVGSGTVTVSGIATASTGTDYDAQLKIASKSYSVTINSQNTDKIGGGSGGGGSFGGGSVSGGNVMAPIIAPPETTVSSKTFTDLSDAPWAEEAILGLYNIQAINMTEECLFYPNREITRAEFLKMVVLANDMYTGSTTVVDFNDVSESDWYYQYVEAAVNFKLIQGDGNGCFRPNDLITREDICVILSRVSAAKNAAMTELFYDDASISDYAKTAVYVMKESGVVNGIGDNLFAPKANATRAMAAKIIYGLVK